MDAFPSEEGCLLRIRIEGIVKRLIRGVNPKSQTLNPEHETLEICCVLGCRNHGETDASSYELEKDTILLK